MFLTRSTYTIFLTTNRLKCFSVVFLMIKAIIFDFNGLVVG